MDPRRPPQSALIGGAPSLASLDAAAAGAPAATLRAFPVGHPPPWTATPFSSEAP
jgi:hypothetical protein